MTKKQLLEYVNGLPDESIVSVRVDLGSGLVVTAEPKAYNIVTHVYEPIESVAGQKWGEYEILIEAKKKRQ